MKLNVVATLPRHSDAHFVFFLLEETPQYNIRKKKLYNVNKEIVKVCFATVFIQIFS